MSNSTTHEFGDARAKIKEGKKGYFAQCGCGWRSREHLEQKEVVIAFEEHVVSDIRHKSEGVTPPPRAEPSPEKRNVNYLSLLLALLGFLYVISPIDLVPDYFIGIGWIGDSIIGGLILAFTKGGLKGKPPTQILSEVLT